MQHTYRFRKAEECFRAARVALDNSLWETAVSRAYYGVFHLSAELMAAKANRNKVRWTHKELHNALLDRFCKKSWLLNQKDGKDYGALREERSAADYDDVSFNQRRVERALRRADELRQKLMEVLGG